MNKESLGIIVPGLSLLVRHCKGSDRVAINTGESHRDSFVPLDTTCNNVLMAV
ncbi:MAG: hypothetical protein HQ477_13930 [Chloroflexi bacterium]|nr:hypothetical protein [Chloroflexota bacterium]